MKLQWKQNYSAILSLKKIYNKKAGKYTILTGCLLSHQGYKNYGYL